MFFRLHVCLARRKFSVAAILLFLELKAGTLRRPQRLWGTDGDGVQNDRRVLAAEAKALEVQ